ncbi:MAG: SoxR reducing system RseC family protein [Flavobacteriaceae bacterium]|nr:SoxR reducing system RseC family protein [Flavobacteriaceae bacterium]
MQKFDLNNEITSNDNLIRHRGIISKITNDVVTVSLLGNVHCEGCNAKAACGIVESDIKEINIDVNSQFYELNEIVELVLQKHLGLKAVFWAYLFPFILLFLCLLITTAFLNEWLAGILSFSILIPYYFLLYLFRNLFKKTFAISILKTI